MKNPDYVKSREGQDYRVTGKWDGCKLPLSHSINAEVFYDRGAYAARVMGRVLPLRWGSEAQAKQEAENVLEHILSEAVSRLRRPWLIVWQLTALRSPDEDEVKL